MESITLRIHPTSPFSHKIPSNYNLLRQTHFFLPFSFCSYQFTNFSVKCCSTVGAKKNPQSEPVLKPSIVEEVSTEEEDDEDDNGFLIDDFDDVEMVDDDDTFQDEYLEEDDEPHIGDGGGGGGISLAGTSWDKEALAIAEEVSLSFDGDLGIYAFKTLPNSTIRVRIEKLSNKSGSPSLEDIEAFSKAYRARLDDEEFGGKIPENISLEVSSPGVERVVRIPQDLDRFKERNMYVKYSTVAAESGAPCDSDGVFKLLSFDPERNCCTWGVADVKINREKAGKGRPLNKKQREWRLETPYDSLLLVRIYSEI